MYGEIITIGDELISGKTLDLNARYAAEKLVASGLRVNRITSVGDDHNMVSKTLSKALNNSRFVIVSGGLGPTDDDLTNEIAAKALNRSLTLNQKMLERIKKYIEEKGMSMTPSIEKMAWMPEGSRLLSPEGFMCGCYINEQDVNLYFLPGVPAQMRYLFDKFVLPELLNIYDTVPSVDHNILKLYGLKEVEIAEAMKELQHEIGDVVLGFYPHFPENHITLSLRAKDKSTVKIEMDRVKNKIMGILGSFIFSSNNQRMEEVVGRKLLDKGITISVAESCTGGLIGHRLTNVAGSSDYFQGGIIVYSNQSKIDFLNVNSNTIETFGAVSDQTVREMVCGIKDRFKTDLALAVTGIAGPDGGTREKPVGTVHLGLAAGDKVFSGKYRFRGTRKQVKLETSMMALDWTRRYLDGNTFIPGI